MSRPFDPEKTTGVVTTEVEPKRLFMSWVRFDGRGNRVTLCKLRSPGATMTKRQ